MTDNTTDMTSLPIDIEYMLEALKEARKGEGRTAPNPCVGAVIVQDGKIIARGYHKKAGTPHAEVHALAAAGAAALGACMYVTLEPCSHTGKTPPCSHAVVEAGIKRVVVGMIDPNPLVAGQGIKYLQANGVEVVTGILEKQCRDINLPFLKHISSGIPFITMKAGISLDGKLCYQKGISGKMTGAASKLEVHAMRNSIDAILIGSGTALVDDPSLTTRLPEEGRDPLRVILDSTLRIPASAKFFHLHSQAATIIYCSKSSSAQKRKRLSAIAGVTVETIKEHRDGGLDLVDVLQRLGKRGVCSVLVEGGANIHSSFLKQGLVDKVVLFIAPVFAGSKGIALLENFSVSDRTNAPELYNVTYSQCGDDLVVRGDCRETYVF